MFAGSTNIPQVIPVVTVSNLEIAEPLLCALRDGGMNYVEIAMRTPVSLDALKIAASIDGVVAGAGTVTGLSILDDVISYGAEFIITPGYSSHVTDEAMRQELPIIPGVATAGEIMQALNAGVQTVKLFPAEALGGLNYINNLAGPFPNIKYLPSGGINHKNYREYLNNPQVAAVSGSWMLPRDLIERRDYESIKMLVQTISEVSQK